MMQYRAIVTMEAIGRRIGNRTQASVWYQFELPSVTSNPDFKITPFFDAEHLRNCTRYRHNFINFNGILIGTYTSLYSTVSFRITLSDLAK